MKTRTAIGVLVAVAVVVGLVQWLGKTREAEDSPDATSSSQSVAGVAAAADTVSEKERSEAWRTAVEKGKSQSSAWPQTPEALIREFWLAASHKDYDRMVVLCPGAVAGDFKKYYDQWTPSPATAVGTPERHPHDAAVVLYPTTVPFPGFPKKTIKMAVKKTDDGRWIIDGAGTIWW